MTPALHKFAIPSLSLSKLAPPLLRILATHVGASAEGTWNVPLVTRALPLLMRDPPWLRIRAPNIFVQGCILHDTS